MGEQYASTQSEFRIAIAGAGIGGLTTAIAFARLLPSNVSVTLFEQATELKAVGASIGIGPNGLRSLYKLGVDPALIEEVAFRQPSRRPFVYLHWLTGEVLKETAHLTVKDPRDAMARFHRADLQKLLLESLPKKVTLKLSKRVKSVRIQPPQDGGRALLAFEDGTTFVADLLVGADGIHSAVRKVFVPDHRLQWTGDILFRSTFDLSLVEKIEGLPDDAVFHCGPDENYLFTSRLGKTQYTVVGQMQSDPDNPENPYRTAQWNTEGDMTKLRDLYKGWHPTVENILKATPSTRLYPNHLGTPLKSMVFESHVALIGDAGHTHGGAFASGGSLAMNDAHALALALAHVWPTEKDAKPDRRQVARALALFDGTRRPHVNKLIELVQVGLAARQAKLRDVRKVEETDEELRERISGLSDIAWLAEHDVEAAFRDFTQTEVAKL
ncbi:Monooxygenase, FAD-binding [Penicillium italicum]|uniref:Monooxygenase, FAD-binding n=1 Tax=Penicillium italicum TaxID=40296 RepID=A0A0A2KWK9_PENIT|nr:Monooxygenase, FAD-binding [Penicillium italicum]